MSSLRIKRKRKPQNLADRLGEQFRNDLMADALASLAAGLTVNEFSTSQRAAFRTCCQALASVETESAQLEVARMLVLVVGLKQSGSQHVIESARGVPSEDQLHDVQRRLFGLSF